MKPEITPMLFSRPMVTALLKDRKTQTRRMIPGLEPMDVYDGDITVNTDNPKTTHPKANAAGYAMFETRGEQWKTIEIPNKKGDIMWAREEHFRFGHWEFNGQSKLGNQKWIFKADNTDTMFPENPPKEYLVSMDRWNPKQPRWYRRNSLFMPMSAARIWMEIEECYPEKIQTISDEDCKAEGVHFDEASGYWFASDIVMEQTPKDAFRMLWYDINGVETWIANPWVWVRKFKVISKTGKP